MEKMIEKLYAYKIDPKGWAKKMIALGTRDNQWDLIVENIGPEIYSFPLFTKEACDMIIQHAEKTGKWTKARHEFYPTTDILLEDIGLKEMYDYVLHNYAHPVARRLWKLEGTKWNKELTSEDFIARYKAEDQAALDIHHDHSDYTFTVGLNVGFEGGGTWFPRQQVLANPKSGYASLFPSVTHRHGGRPTTKGTRYIVVSFVKKGV
jgi:hypothetical protein